MENNTEEKTVDTTTKTDDKNIFRNALKNTKEISFSMGKLILVFIVLLFTLYMGATIGTQHTGVVQGVTNTLSGRAW